MTLLSCLLRYRYFTDPAYNENLSKTSYAVFDAARSADGTDDDVILVPPL